MGTERKERSVLTGGRRGSKDLLKTWHFSPSRPENSGQDLGRRERSLWLEALRQKEITPSLVGRELSEGHADFHLLS